MSDINLEEEKTISELIAENGKMIYKDDELIREFFITSVVSFTQTDNKFFYVGLSTSKLKKVYITDKLKENLNSVSMISPLDMCYSAINFIIDNQVASELPSRLRISKLLDEPIQNQMIEGRFFLIEGKLKIPKESKILKQESFISSLKEDEEHKVFVVFPQEQGSLLVQEIDKEIGNNPVQLIVKSKKEGPNEYIYRVAALFTMPTKV